MLRERSAAADDALRVEPHRHPLEVLVHDGPHADKGSPLFSSQPSSTATFNIEMSSVRKFAIVFLLRWLRLSTKSSTRSTPLSRPNSRTLSPPNVGRRCRRMMLSSSWRCA